MLAGVHAIDADAHVYEDPFLIAKRAPEHLKKDLPQSFGRVLGYRFKNQIAYGSRSRWAAFERGGWEELRRHVEDVEGGGSHVRSANVTHDLFPGVAMMSDGSPWHQRYPELPEHYDDKWYPPHAVAAELNRQGFDEAFMYPSIGLFWPSFDGLGPMGIECCRIYNDWLYEYCSYNPVLFKPVAMVSLHEPALAIEEVRRTHRLGFAAVCLSRFPDGRTSADADLEPFWSLCEQLGMLVSFHPVPSNAYLSDPPLERSGSPFESFNANMFAQHFANLLISGTLERHPNLRIALLESGCGWLPSVLWRLDRMFYKSQTFTDVWGREIPRLLAGLSRDELRENIKMPPVDYFRRQCYIECEAEPFVEEVANLIGEDRIVFQGDFPHPDHHPSYIQDFVNIVPERLRKKILCDNPREMYRRRSDVPSGVAASASEVEVL